MSNKKFAVLGYGTVGKGVAEVWDELENAPLDLGPILVRKDYPNDRFRSHLVRDFSRIENDPDVVLVAEVIGGKDAAYDYSRRALLAGKSVVSSNKELVAAYGPELCALAKEHGVSYLYEASVGGGIPLLRPLTRCLAANRIEGVRGILNGTTNFILTSMKKEGRSFDSVLKQAQELGYAEADPTADVEGLDAARKTAILADISFGKHFLPEDLFTMGIRKITPNDFALAGSFGYEIKLLGQAKRTGEGIYASVQPQLVPVGSTLSAAEWVTNACVVNASAAGEVCFIGPGAGARPTASAVCADIFHAASHPGDCMELSAEPGTLQPESRQVSRWYVRCGKKPEAAESAEVNGEFALLTEPATRTAVEAAFPDAALLLRVAE